MQLFRLDNFLEQLYRDDKIDRMKKISLMDCAKEAFSQGGHIQIYLNHEGKINLTITYVNNKATNKNESSI